MPTQNGQSCIQCPSFWHRRRGLQLAACKSKGDWWILCMYALSMTSCQACQPCHDLMPVMLFIHVGRQPKGVTGGHTCMSTTWWMPWRQQCTSFAEVRMEVGHSSQDSQPALLAGSSFRDTWITTSTTGHCSVCVCVCMCVYVCVAFLLWVRFMWIGVPQCCPEAFKPNSFAEKRLLLMPR